MTAAMPPARQRVVGALANGFAPPSHTTTCDTTMCDREVSVWIDLEESTRSAGHGISMLHGRASDRSMRYVLDLIHSRLTARDTHRPQSPSRASGDTNRQVRHLPIGAVAESGNASSS
jgi:hypothetical protein